MSGSAYKVGDEPVRGYQIIRPLGEGGFGTVWVARSPGAVENALKIINLQGQGLKEYRAIGLVKNLRHPNLIPINAYWLKDEYGNLVDSTSQDSVNLRGKSFQLIIAMGLGDKSLAQRLDECKRAYALRHGLPDTGDSLIAKLQDLNGSDLAGIPAEELLDYMFGAAKAIDFLNQATHKLGSGPAQGIQHCDIKPGNLLIVGNDVQVCDYGLARVADDTRKTEAAGTRAYTPPEQLNNKPTKGTDQYSLAITYYELRTGRLPFEESLAYQAHILGQLDYSLLKPEEQEILRRATRIKPAERYPTTLEMVRGLREALTPTRPPTMTGVHRSDRPPVASSSTPTIYSKPQVLDDLIRAGIEIVPGHKLEQLLGRGGYGEVWSATKPGKMRCALKIVRNLEGVQGKQELRSLDMIRELEHDRLIRLQAYWLLANDGSVIPDEQLGEPSAPKAAALVVATDLAAQNLQQRWQECYDQGHAGIELAELVSYMRQSAEAIDHLNFHDHALVHRDIKPENILLTRDRRVKVSDFGLAKAVEGTNAAISAASVGMTLAYAAPEMFRNQVTRWTDQYSLAVTYYRLRVGRLPFEDGLGPIQMMQAHATGALDFAGVPEPEQAVLRRACALEPEARYGSSVEFIRALAAAVGISQSGSSDSVVASPIPTPVGSSGNVYRETALYPGGGGGSAYGATAQYPSGGSDAGSDVQKTMHFAPAKAAAGLPDHPSSSAVQPGSGSPVRPSTGGWDAPSEPKRSSGLPAGLMETINRVPSPEEDTDANASESGWRDGRGLPPGVTRPPTGTRWFTGKRVLAIAVSVAVLAAGAFGAYKIITPRPLPPLAERMEQKNKEVEQLLASKSFDTAENLVGDTVARETPQDEWQKWGQERQKHIKEARTSALANAKEQEVTTLLDQNAFDAALKVVASGKEFGDKWVTGQHALILVKWKAFAESKESPDAKLADYEKIEAARLADESVRNRIQELRGDKTLVALRDALGSFKDRKYDDCEPKLAALGEMKPAPTVAGKVQKVRDAVRILRQPDGEQRLIGLADKINELKADTTTSKAELDDAFRSVLAAEIVDVIPKLGEKSNWRRIAEACKDAVPGTPDAKSWLGVCQAECVAELKHNSETVDPTEVVQLPDLPAGADEKLSAYRQYANAALAWEDGKNESDKAAKAADQLASLTDEPNPPLARLSEYRCRRAFDSLREAVAPLRGGDRFAPYTARAADASRWLTAAGRLAVRLASDGTSLKPDERKQLDFETALALLARQPPADAQARELLTAQLVADTDWTRTVEDRILLWTSYARCRDLKTPGGRRDAVRSLTEILVEARNNPSLVPVDFLYPNVVQRLDPANDKSDVIGATPEDALKSDAARLCALAARNLHRRNDWSAFGGFGSDDAGREKRRKQLTTQLFERATGLKPTDDEYRAWAGICRYLARDADAKSLRRFLPVGVPAAGQTEAPAVCLLRGIQLTLDALSDNDWQAGVKKREEAEKVFQGGIKQLAGSEPGDRWNELVVLYECAADNCIRLANVLANMRSAKPDEIQGHLAKAVKYAGAITDLDQESKVAHDIRGCALEDMAWLLKNAEMFSNYKEASIAFTAGTVGFGQRPQALMHRGRCQFKWAEDLILHPPEKVAPATTLRDAKTRMASAVIDLTKAAKEERGTDIAIEADFWLARAAQLKWTMPPSDAGTIILDYKDVAKHFEAAAKQALELKDSEWRAATLQFWALAAYDAANKLADRANELTKDKKEAAEKIFEQARDRAEKAKEISKPWAALLQMDLFTVVRPKLDGKVYLDKAHLEAAERAGQTGLGGDKEKSRQFEILIRLVEYRTSLIKAFEPHRDGPKALERATEALALAKSAALGQDAEAEAHGAFGRAYLFKYGGFGNGGLHDPDDLEAAKKEFKLAAGSASADRAWKFKYFLANLILPRGQQDDTPETANRFAEAYMLYREAEDAAKAVTADDKVISLRITQERAGVDSRWWVTLIGREAEKKNPNRPRWLLAAAEALAVQGKLQAARPYLQEARPSLPKLAEAERKQAERIEKLLAPAKAEPNS
jgi:serine/threonine protein kinase